MKIMSCNAGSTSLKFKVFSMPEETVLAEGKIERVGSADDAIFRYRNPAKKIDYTREKERVPDYKAGIEMFLESLLDREDGAFGAIEEIEAVSFKTVLAKGFSTVHLLTDDVMDGMREYMDIAASHNGPYIDCITEIRSLLPRAKLVGVFETAFHQTIPLERTLYGLPYAWYEKYGLRRMGYHGASHSFVAGRIREIHGEKHKVISCHLGGSGSVCAILDGKSVDTSFGISLHTGLMHGSRTGDADAFIVPFLLGRGMSLAEINTGLTRKGGVLGISGVSDDMRYVEEAAEKGNERACLALDVYASHIIHYIGAFFADLGGLDYLVFTGGIGEKSPVIREKVSRALRHFGISLDRQKNAEKITEEKEISSRDSKVKILVIPANEELEITRKAWDYVRENP